MTGYRNQGLLQFPRHVFNEARLAATRLGHKVGDRTTLDVLNAENDAANARLAWMQARITLTMDRLRLVALTGKLEEDQLQVINATLQAAVY